MIKISNPMKAGLILGWIMFCGSLLPAAPLRVVATTPDLADLVRAVGGAEVAVTTLARGTEDPHFVEPRPSLVKDLNAADLLVTVGMDLEIGWLPALIGSARNPAVAPGGRGHLDASTVIGPLEVPEGPVDRSMGDVHPGGNPHYLLDPVNGMKVAEAVRERLAALRPARADEFARRGEDFRRRLAEALVGSALAVKYDAAKLLRLHEAGRLTDFLRQQGDFDALGGWIRRLLPHFGARVVADHNLWPYFARRYGLVIAGLLEPKPGIPPTTRHLARIVDLMKSEGIGVVLATPYYNPRYAEFVAEHTGARVIPMAHQLGSRPETGDYIAAAGYNVRQLAEALDAR
jgi:ABC-type Zn uptake system ZnuABC Zn-binding protein ZnuA